MAKTDPRIEALEREIATLVERRQEMRANGAEAVELETNRRDIVTRQHRLSEALISIYAPPAVLAVA